jgi:tetratricopeptide (TPR) repeat protein
LKDLNEAIELDPSLDQAWYVRGNVKYNLRDNEGAMKDYDQCIVLNPNHAEAYANRGSLKFDMGDRDGACKDWMKAKECGKENMSSQLMNCN